MIDDKKRGGEEGRGSLKSYCEPLRVRVAKALGREITARI